VSRTNPLSTITSSSADGDDDFESISVFQLYLVILTFGHDGAIALDGHAFTDPTTMAQKFEKGAGGEGLRLAIELDLNHGKRGSMKEGILPCMARVCDAQAFSLGATAESSAGSVSITEGREHVARRRGVPTV
jgi:hypothetical protein